MKVLHGDSLTILPTLPANSIDAIVTDPPYCLDSIRKRFGSATAKPTSARQHRGIARGFMGHSWDDDIAFRTDVWRECLRVLKPGGYMAVFGGSRTHHRVWVAVEDAGFEIRDTLMWLYAQGFPKSLNVSVAIDKLLGAEREVVGSVSRTGATGKGGAICHEGGDMNGLSQITAPATPEAQQWQGWGTALKPSHEPILLARKPLEGNTVAQNVLEHGTGGINVDACRVPFESGDDKASWRYGAAGKENVSPDCWKNTSKVIIQNDATGRWPANLLLDGSEEVVECFPQSKSSGSGGQRSIHRGATQGASNGGMQGGYNLKGGEMQAYADEGSAARFFPALGYSDDERRVMYCPKASKRDRAGSIHPTIKPIKLMEWLCRLITPPGGTILDPFAGSGTTGQAAMNCGFDCILIEREDAYVADIQRRMGQSDGVFKFVTR